MATVPVIATLQKAVNGIVDQIGRLELRIDVLRIPFVENPTCISLIVAESRTVRIERRVDISVMRTVDSCPPNRGALEREIAAQYEEILN